MDTPGLREISLVRCEGTTVAFEDASFTVTSHGDEVRVSGDPTNYALVTAATETVPYESTVGASIAVNEERFGNIDYASYFVVQWDDELGLPSLLFRRPPRLIERSYAAGQAMIKTIGRFPANVSRRTYRPWRCAYRGFPHGKHATWSAPSFPPRWPC